MFATDVLDGGMIVLAIYTINFFHPGLLLAHIYDGQTTCKGSQRNSNDEIPLAQTTFVPSALEKGKNGSYAAVGGPRIA